MNPKTSQIAGLLLLAFAAAAFAGCSQDGGHGMGTADSAAPDSFTSAVQSIAGNAPDDATPVDIDAISVVLVDDRPPVTLQ